MGVERWGGGGGGGGGLEEQRERGATQGCIYST